ncbi:MAG TPA: hypothetical protein VKV95_22185 [Terriglobia bacterium]|nr:hypothetical protein [Terriglobia bacterium]
MADEPPKAARKPRYTMSAAALASRRANLERARAAPPEKIYRQTEKRQAASRANLAKAIAARKSPRGNASARLNALSHGLFVRDVARSVRRMGEDPAEFLAHHKLFFRIFAPLDDQERAWVQRIADINWKRLRYFRAMPVWELNALKIGFVGLPRQGPISVLETERRVGYLSRLLTRYIDHMDPISRFQARMDREIRKLLLKRSEGKIKYRVYRTRKEAKDPFESMLDKMLDDVLKPRGEE